jgi:hypothetical protein
MAAWPDRLEHFLDHYPHIIAAVEAISTFGAVVVSLSLAFAARRSHNTRLRARVQRTTVTSSALSRFPVYVYVSVSITNTGILPLRFSPSFLQLKVPFRRTTWMIRVLEDLQTDLLIPQKTFPVEIVPARPRLFSHVRSTTFAIFSIRWLQRQEQPRSSYFDLSKLPLSPMMECVSPQASIGPFGGN